KERAIGTTKKGIGPAYEDKVRRTGVRAGELKHLAALRLRVEAAVEAWAPVIEKLGGTLPDVTGIIEQLKPLADRLVPMLADTSRLADDALKQNKRVMLEGAQGTLLDID